MAAGQSEARLEFNGLSLAIFLQTGNKFSKSSLSNMKYILAILKMRSACLEPSQILTVTTKLPELLLTKMILLLTNMILWHSKQIDIEPDLYNISPL